jgi:hypothetical protein
MKGNSILMLKDTTKEARDNFLSGLIGECEHEFDNTVVLTSYPPQIICKKCGATQIVGEVQEETDFSSWKGLGKLVEWMDNNWSTDIKRGVLNQVTYKVPTKDIPDAVANFVYNETVKSKPKEPTFVKDQKVKVKDCEEHDWVPRHYSHYDPQSGRHYCFTEGRTSWTAESGAAICWSIIENGEEEVQEEVGEESMQPMSRKKVAVVLMDNKTRLIHKITQVLPENCEVCRHKKGCEINGSECDLLELYDQASEIIEREEENIK